MVALIFQNLENFTATNRKTSDHAALESNITVIKMIIQSVHEQMFNVTGFQYWTFCEHKITIQQGLSINLKTVSRQSMDPTSATGFNTCECSIMGKEFQIRSIKW